MTALNQSLTQFQKDLLTLITNYGKLIQDGEIDAMEDSAALNEIENYLLCIGEIEMTALED